eukprot:scaffold1536_cov397-Prasinococcus_capsulatus_cf.AAC.27
MSATMEYVHAMDTILPWAPAGGGGSLARTGPYEAPCFASRPASAWDAGQVGEGPHRHPSPPRGRGRPGAMALPNLAVGPGRPKRAAARHGSGNVNSRGGGGVGASLHASAGARGKPGKRGPFRWVSRRAPLFPPNLVARPNAALREAPPVTGRASSGAGPRRMPRARTRKHLVGEELDPCSRLHQQRQCAELGRRAVLSGCTRPGGNGIPAWPETPETSRPRSDDTKGSRLWRVTCTALLWCPTAGRTRPGDR